MLYLLTIVPLFMKDKMRYVSREMAGQLPERLNKQMFVDFDRARFLNDLATWLKKVQDQYDGEHSYASG